MEKRISVLIGRTIFSLMKNYHISILIAIRFFSLVKKIVLSFCSQHGRRVGEGAKGYLAFMSTRRRVSPIKKHEMERRTALTHYLGKITEKQMV